MPTLKDIAELAGVSTASVSLYLNGKADGRVSKPKQRNIKEAIDRLSYQPTTAIKALRNTTAHKQSYTIALYWASDSRSNLLGRVLAGFQSSFIRDNISDFNIIICPYTAGELYREKSLLNPEFYNYDAAIIGNTTYMDMQYLDSITPSIPVILFNRNSEHYNSIGINNEKMGIELADLVSEHGHKDVAIFRSLSPFVAMDSRVNGFINGCRQNNITIPNEAVFCIEDSVNGGIEAVKMFSSLNSRPEVIFCGSDSIALGALYELHRVNIKVPDDVSVISVGMNYPSVAECSIPSLTTSEVPIEKMAALCMEHIIDIIQNGEKEIFHLVIDTEIYMRESFR